MKVKLIFSRQNKLFSWIIRVVTFSRWSHVDINETEIVSALNKHGAKLAGENAHRLTPGALYIAAREVSQ